MSKENPFAEAIGILQANVPYHGDSLFSAIRVLEAAGDLTADDKLWLEHRVDLSIGEYTPIIDGMVCPGRAMKDRFRALLSALPGDPR
jgi:hypothetical protein